MEHLFSYRNKSFRNLVKENINAILYTLIFHLVVLIILIFVKTEGLKNDHELGVLLEFEERTIEEILEDEMIEVPAEFIELIQQQRELASNRAVNANAEDAFNKEISTEDYMQQLLEEIEAGRDDEIIRDREEWRKVLEAGGYIEPVAETQDEEPEEYTGPTTITYQFEEEPLDRGKSFLKIPVYLCQGAGLVRVEARVARDGSVVSAEVQKPVEGADATCFANAAKEAALTSRFSVDPDAPEMHRVLITYTFIAQ